MPTTTCLLTETVLHASRSEETFRLAHSATLARDGWSAHPLIDRGSLRAALVAITAGGVITEHRTEGSLLMQGVYGRVYGRAGGHVCALEPGDLICFPAGKVHAVESPGGGTLLLIATVDGTAQPA